MNDDQNSQKMLVDCTHIVNIEISVDPWPVGCSEAKHKRFSSSKRDLFMWARR